MPGGNGGPEGVSVHLLTILRGRALCLEPSWKRSKIHRQRFCRVGLRLHSVGMLRVNDNSKTLRSVSAKLLQISLSTLSPESLSFAPLYVYSWGPPLSPLSPSQPILPTSRHHRNDPEMGKTWLSRECKASGLIINQNLLGDSSTITLYVDQY